MIDIPTMLQRGFGLVSVSDLISLSLHDDVLECHFEPLPGVVDVYTFPIESRTTDGIIEEIRTRLYFHLSNYLNWQFAELMDINRVS